MHKHTASISNNMEGTLIHTAHALYTYVLLRIIRVVYIGHSYV